MIFSKKTKERITTVLLAAILLVLIILINFPGLADRILVIIANYFSQESDDHSGPPPAIFSHDKRLKTDFTCCTEDTQQPACYPHKISPVLRWECKPGSQVDDALYMFQLSSDPDFTSIQYDSGEVTAVQGKFTIDNDSLEPESEYYWRMNIRFDENDWTGWVHHENPFVPAPMCPGINK